MPLLFIFENFFVTHMPKIFICPKIVKKCDFFDVLILTRPLLWPETDKLSKKIGQDPQVFKILAKKFLVTIRPKMTEKIQKVDPPPQTVK